MRFCRRGKYDNVAQGKKRGQSPILKNQNKGTAPRRSKDVNTRTMPKASVVIPCYNAERFVAETIQSAQRQTMHDLEIICVDDGSTDNTLGMLNRLAAEDGRMRVISQPNGGEGPARDAGLAAARGSWLYFLDSDDLMEPTLLEEAIAECERHKSDLVVFRTITVNEQTGEERLCDYSFKRDWMPQSCFCPQEHPNRLFNSFQNWVHNKLFRASFVRAHGLRMQHVHRTADLLFTCRALAEASRVSLLDKPLHRYRINNPASAMATSDAYPLDFLSGFYALRSSLRQHGTWELYHDSFVNWAIEGIASNLRCARSYQGFSAIVQELQSRGFNELDIRSFPRHKADNTEYYDLVRALIDLTPEEALFRFMVSYRTMLGQAENDLSRASMAIEDITSSASFRIGRAITSLPRTARDKLVRGR